MASIKDTAATSALNEKKYINELYDTQAQNRNQLLKDNLDSGNAVLDNAQQMTQDLTDSYIDRTQVEAGTAKELYGDGSVSTGAQAQVLLDQENARRRNVTALRGAQETADAEFQRQRQLLASQYEADIRQAQADNDMKRAQALYEAAKAEEAQLLKLQKQGAALMAGKGNNAGYEAIAAGQTLPADTTGDSWEEVFRNEDPLNAVYDAQLESQRAQLDAQYAQAVSELEAQRETQERQNDAQLTDAYVNSLRSRQRGAELGAAAGYASGTAAQDRLADDIQLQDTLTALRVNQLGSDAKAAGQHFEVEKQWGQALDRAQYDSDMARAKALFDAAENEEQVLIGNQEFIGKQAAANGDYSILAALYGLPVEQVTAAPGTWYTPTPGTDTGNGEETGENATIRPGTVGGNSVLPMGYVGASVPNAYNAMLDLVNKGQGSGFPNR